MQYRPKRSKKGERPTTDEKERERESIISPLGVYKATLPLLPFIKVITGTDFLANTLAQPRIEYHTQWIYTYKTIYRSLSLVLDRNNPSSSLLPFQRNIRSSEDEERMKSDPSK